MAAAMKAMAAVVAAGAVTAMKNDVGYDNDEYDDDNDNDDNKNDYNNDGDGLKNGSDDNRGCGGCVFIDERWRRQRKQQRRWWRGQ